MMAISSSLPKYLILVFLPVGSGKDLKADIQISGGNGSLLGATRISRGRMVRFGMER